MMSARRRRKRRLQRSTKRSTYPPTPPPGDTDGNQEALAKAQLEYKKIKVHTGTFTVPPDLVHSPAGPEPSEIVLLAASDGKGHNGGIKNILADITPNRQEYADFHGYKYQFLNISKYSIGGAHAVWAKLPAIVETFNLHPQAKWIWWLDLDAIIMTATVDLRTHLLSHDALKEKMLLGFEMNRSGGGLSGFVTQKNPDLALIDLIITQDQNGLNAGSFFIRRSEFTKIFIDMWADPFYVHGNSHRRKEGGKPTIASCSCPRKFSRT